jgi:hypothetical protein
MTRRQEFPKSVKLVAWERCKGMCECDECKGRLKVVGVAEFDHYPVPAALGGPGTLENCRVLSPKCHRRITSTKDQPTIAKAIRVHEKQIGARVSRTPMPGGRRSKWRKRMDGRVERR